MKNQFRVLAWSYDATKVEQGVNGEEIPVEGSTIFRVELSQVDMQDVNTVVGTVYITLNRITEFTATAKEEIAVKLASLGLYAVEPATPLEEAKQLRWARLLAIRDGLEAKGFDYLGKTFDSDERALFRILATAQAATSAALLGQEFSVTWTTADNSSVTMTRDQVLGMPAALALKANEIHTKARNLKQVLDNATTILQVQNIYWDGVEPNPNA